jgi:hypothetical protein
MEFFLCIKSRGSSVGVATGYRHDRGIGVRVSVGKRVLISSYHPDRSGDPASCPMDTGGSFPRGKAPVV